MPRDGPMQAPQPPRPERPPTRDEILASIRQQNSGHLIEQVISLEADKAVLMNELVVERRVGAAKDARIAELEAQLASMAEGKAEPPGCLVDLSEPGVTPV